MEAYRLLAPERLGTPHCYASGRRWLALEKIDGVELWQRGDLEAWTATATWAARLHERFAGRRLAARRLLRRDEALHRRVLARAQARLADRLTPELTAASELAIARLAALPPTVVHGELYASNVLVGDGRIAPVDWEMTSVGPGVVDLAALVTGWQGADRQAIVAAYGEAETADLASAELLLALQWLGWTKDWQAPREQQHDWLAEAQAAAERLR